MMKKLLIGLLLVAPLGAYADYYDKCASILAKGVFETAIDREDYKARSSMETFMCSSLYANERQEIEKSLCKETEEGSSWAGKGKASLIDILSASGKANASKAFKSKYCTAEGNFKYGAWSSDYCESEDRKQSSSSVTHKLMKTASSDIVEAWKQCVLKEKQPTDLVCYGYDADDLIRFYVAWDHKYATTMDVERFIPVNLTQFGDEPKLIRKGRDQFVFERKDPKKAAIIQITAIEKYDNKEHALACDYAVPPAPCKNPVYRKGRDEACGIERNIVGTGKICGVKQYKMGRGEGCGVELYKSAANSACGTNYKMGTGSVCGCAKRDSCENSAACGWHSCALIKKCEVKSCVNDSCACVRHHKCRAPEFGVESHKTCRHASNGPEQFKECRLPVFGVEEYNTCEHPSFGMVYNECRLPKFGIERCAD